MIIGTMEVPATRSPSSREAMEVLATRSPSSREAREVSLSREPLEPQELLELLVASKSK